MRIALATDHAGYEAAIHLAEFITSLGHQVVDFGPHTLDPNDDYPNFITPAAVAVASGDCQAGIILGGSGQGEAMAANRIKGVRAAVFYGPVQPIQPIDIEGDVSHDPYEIVKLSRAHNDANMLSLAGRFVSLEQIKQAITLWLSQPFSGEARHERRIKELDD